MKVTLTDRHCIVEREATDQRITGGPVNAAGESLLLYRIKCELNAKGHDLIKKRMHKDGHLVDDLQQYIRTRSSSSPQPHIYILNDRWAIEGADAIYNRDGRVVLSVYRDVFQTQEKS